MDYPSKKRENFLIKKGYRRIAGVDEAGRGALAGPLVAAAVILNIEGIALPVRDSKQLSPHQREELYSLITKEAVDYSVGIIQPREIDKIGVGPANRKAMELAIKNLKVRPDYLLIDYYFINTGLPFENIKQGDRKVYSISAASIVAKVTRDRILKSYKKRYGAFSFDSHKGYGTRDHYKEIKKYGPTPCHRRSFRLR